MQSFVLTVPGLGPFVVHEARRLGLRPGRVTNDGRADAVAFDGPPPRLQTAEQAFDAVRDLRRVTRPVRLIVRVQDETHFTRRDLRRRYAQRLGRLMTDRAGADELWVLQMRERQVWVGLRVAQPAAPRRVVELPGALPPAVAAAMVELVVDRGLVVDPCCGSGTIPLVLGTAIAADLSADAVAAAHANGVASLLRADARRVPIRDNSATAVVTNLPFGRQHLVQGSPVAWYRRVLSETLRIAPQAVVLAAATTPFRQALGRLDVDLRSRHDLVLRGNRTAIWDVRRQSSGSARRKVSPRGERR